jgi:LCP family protein required for cell wall assembly
MKRASDISQKLNNILFFMAGVVVVVVVGVLAIAVQAKTHSGTGDATVTADNVVQETQQEGIDADVEKWQEGAILYKDAYYIYNDNIRSYLIMGVDSDDPVETAPDGVSGGQSDAMFLMVVDSENETLSVISINRNTMTDVAAYDENGMSLGTVEAQICTQHGFGDGKKLSCTRTVNAVKKLFYNIPISGYVAINMGAVPTLNDAIGGVRVKVLQDLSYPENGVELTEGAVVTLSGKEAYAYLRGRDTNDFDSATDRLRREEQYVINYMNQLRSYASGDADRVVQVYDSVSDYLVSSVDFATLAEELLNYEFSDDIMYTVPGETQMGDEFEEYYVNEDEFYDLVIRIFYTKVE